MGADVKKADADPIIQDALRRELALFETRERLVLSEIADMERKYDMTSSEFWSQTAAAHPDASIGACKAPPLF